MLQSIFNSRLSIHLIIRHSIYPVGIITRYKLCATTDCQKVELTMKTPLITREGYEKLKQEMDYLWRQERPEVTKKVTWAASLGDRSENADYQYNKKRLREIDRRVRYLTKCLEQLKIVDYSPQQEGKVFFGAWVEIENDEGDIKRFRIVGYDEIFGRKDYISIDSPMARKILKKDELNVMYELSHFNSYIDKNMQVQNLELSIERLKRINENVAMDIAPRMKICRIGGITAGVFIAIMLI